MMELERIDHLIDISWKPIHPLQSQFVLTKQDQHNSNAEETKGQNQMNTTICT